MKKICARLTQPTHGSTHKRCASAGATLPYEGFRGREKERMLHLQFDLSIHPEAVAAVITSDNYGKLKKKTARRDEGTNRHMRSVVPSARMKQPLANCDGSYVKLRDCGLESSLGILGDGEADICHMSLRALFVVGVNRINREPIPGGASDLHGAPRSLNLTRLSASYSTGSCFIKVPARHGDADDADDADETNLDSDADAASSADDDDAADDSTAAENAASNEASVAQSVWMREQRPMLPFVMGNFVKSDWLVRMVKENRELFTAASHSTNELPFPAIPHFESGDGAPVYALQRKQDQCLREARKHAKAGKTLIPDARVDLEQVPSRRCRFLLAVAKSDFRVL